jgi:hypothetical protein
MTRVEGENSRLRHYLARLNRKTFCYSKSKEMLCFSIKLLIYYLREKSFSAISLGVTIRVLLKMQSRECFAIVPQEKFFKLGENLKSSRKYATPSGTPFLPTIVT